MPTFSQSLEQSLHRALAIANERHHQYATLEHLLLSLIDDSDAAAVMRACSVDLDKLRGLWGEAKQFPPDVREQLQTAVSDRVNAVTKSKQGTA